MIHHTTLEYSQNDLLYDARDTLLYCISVWEYATANKSDLLLFGNNTVPLVKTRLTLL